MSHRKRKPSRYDLHHRKPKSRGGKGGNNLSRVRKVEHALWHQLFWNLRPDEICLIINNVWLDPDYYFTCHRKGV